MEDNLIYNGDFSKGTDGWIGSGLTVENGVATLNGTLVQDVKYLIPISSKNKYKISCDIKINSITSNNPKCYIALCPYDEDLITISSWNTSKVSNIGDTTLAENVQNGDTTVTLTSTNGWKSDTTYRTIGICDNPKWGYNRCTKYEIIKQNGISGNIIELKNPWSIGPYSAGTKVGNFTDANVFIYPVSFQVTNNLLNKWITYEGTYIPNNENGVTGYGANYYVVSIALFGHQYNYSIRNFKFIDVNGVQKNIFEDDIITTPHKNGTVTSAFLEQPETSDAKILHYGNLVSSEFKEV